MKIVCSRGTVQIDFHRQCWRWQTDPAVQWQEETSTTMERDDYFVRQANYFLDAIESSDLSDLCSIEEGLQTLRVNLAILKAADTQTWQRAEK